MSKCSNKLSNLLTLLLVLQLLFPSVNALAVTSSILPPSNVTSQFLAPENVKLAWSPVYGATGYNVYSIVYGQLQLAGNTTTVSYAMNDLPEGSYSYVVSTLSADGESGPGAPVNVNVVYPDMAAPATLTYTIQSGNNVVLSWGASTYAQTYNVYQLLDGGQKKLITSGAARTYTINNALEGTFSYAVSAVNSKYGESPLSTPVQVLVDYPTMTAPGGFGFTVTNATDVTLKWNAVNYATNYKVYQIIDGQKVLKNTVTTTTVKYSGLPAGDYVFEVHSYSDRFGESAAGSQATLTVNAVTMSAPGKMTFNIQNLTDVVLTWDAAPNATGYKVYQIIDGQKVLKSTVTGTTVTYINLPAGDYIYEVHSTSTRYGESLEGTRVSFTMEGVSMAAPANLAYTFQNGNDIVLTWDAAANATNYKVYQVVNGRPVLKNTLTGTSTTFANMSAGDYSYEVHSNSTRYGESVEGSKVSFTLVLPSMLPPKNVIQTIKNATDFALSWEVSDYATSYKVYQIVNGQKVLKSTVGTTTVSYAGMQPGDYTYEVHSLSARFGESSEGTQLIFTLSGQTMQAPASLTYSLANVNDIVLKWTAAPYATSYKVYQVIDGEKVLKSTATGLNVTYTNMPGGDYTYVVNSVSTFFGESAEGAEVKFTLILPAMPAPGGFAYKVQNGNDVVLSWAAAQYATSYKVYELIDGQKVLKNTGSALTVTLSNVASGDHTYVVHSVSNRFGESLEGSSVSFNLDQWVMQAPDQVTQTVTNGNDITLRWGTVTYATYYNVYQVIDGQKVLKKTSTAATATWTNMPEGKYLFEVHSVSSRFGESPDGGQLSFDLVFPVMQKPGTLTSSVTNGNDITLRWGTAAYATAYKLYQIVDGEKVLKKTQSGTSLTYSNMPEDEYNYEVHSYSDRFGESAEGSPLTFTLIHPTMQAPGNITYTITNGNDITLRWSGVSYATAYRVYQVTDTDKVLKKTLTGAAVTFTNMPESNYKYEIHSYSDRFGESPAAGEANFALTWPVVQPPTLKGTVFNANNITFTWQAVTWANEYRVYEVTGDTRQLIYKGTALTTKVFNLSEMTHEYVVTAFSNRFGESEPSARVTEEIIYPEMQAPAAGLTLLSDTSARISWNFITYANGYNVYEMIDGKPVALVQNLNNLSYTISNLSYANHLYYVTSYSNSFGESSPSEMVEARLIVDTEPPVTTANTPAGWTNQDTTVILSFTDNETGVANSYYSINDMEFAMGSSFTVSEEGVNKVIFYSVDKVGNKEEVKTSYVKVDKTAPITSASEVKTWSNTANLILTTTDALSGVEKTLYSVNGAGYLEGTSVTVSDEGINEISFYSVDLAGNTEKVQTVQVKVDRTAPVTKADAPADWAKEDVSVTLTATDAHSGIAKTLYSLNGAEYVEGATFTVTKEGINEISFYSVDLAGNAEKEQTVQVKVDRTAPVTKADTPADWAKGDVSVTFTATDVHSGIAKTLYSVNGAEYVEGNSLTVTQEGVNRIAFYSVDQAGNTEQVQTVDVKIDRTAPVINMSLNNEYKLGSTLQLNYTANDDLSGIISQSMTVVGPNEASGNAVTNGSGIQLDRPGVYTVTVVATNAAGLTTTTQKQFAVYIPARIEVTPNVIKGNKGVFTVRVDLPKEYGGSTIDLLTATVNGVKALSDNNGYYNQAKLGQFKFERADFTWNQASERLEFRAYVNDSLIVGETTVKVQK